MEIRRATERDAPQVVSCVVEAFKGYMPLIQKTPGPMLEDYYEAILHEDVFVVPEGDRILGILLLKKGEGSFMWLDVLATLPSCQGAGIGQALLLFGEDFMVAQGMTQCRLYTHVSYERVIALYLRMGYEIYDRVREHGFERYYFKKRLTEAGR